LFAGFRDRNFQRGPVAGAVDHPVADHAYEQYSPSVRPPMRRVAG
jgi:hypothetical protein